VNLNLGRHVFGTAALAFGLVALVWPRAPGNGAVFGYAGAFAQIVGGLALQFRPTARFGAVLSGAMFLIVTGERVPHIIAMPQIYNSWGNFFEQVCLMIGAALAYVQTTRPKSDVPLRICRIALGICVVSFTVAQAVYFGSTVTLVPKWLPPSQTFWAVATTGALALAALALIANRSALLATRLLTIMIGSFGIFVWVPSLVSDPHNHGHWSETVETFAIAGTAWILADILGQSNVALGSGRRESGSRISPG
jgi:hypothetical protein